MQEIIFQKGINWNDLPVKQKRGRQIIKEEFEKEGATRTRWVSVDAPDFNKEREELTLIPEML